MCSSYLLFLSFRSILTRSIFVNRRLYMLDLGQKYQSGFFRRLVAIIVLILFAAPMYAEGPVIVQVDRSTPAGASHFNIGVTHTQPDWDKGNPQAVARAKSLLADGLKFQNQHLMDWGTENPEPKPGVYNWASLDHRVALMRSMGATVVITLCTAPGWMKTSGEDFPHQTGPDSWADDRVADDHVNDFVELSKRVALRYPDVKYFQV